MNKRKYRRIEKPYMAGVQVKQHEGHETGWDSVTLHSLSEGEAFFIYKKELGIGTLIDFEIGVSIFKLPLNPVGKVIRIKQFQLPSTSMFCITIKFIDIGEHEKEAINTAVEKVLKHYYQTYLDKATTPFLDGRCLPPLPEFSLNGNVSLTRECKKAILTN